ncbi:MAG: transcriptional repressor LexA [Acutalibacteraceae bacterium]
MKNLSVSQQKILDYLKRCSSAPSVREICQATGLKSTSTVHAHLKTLEEQGYIERSRLNRSIRLTGTEDTTAVPLLGTVTAGLPILAIETIEGYIPFPKSKSRGRELFALHVCGESMKDAGIMDGDIIICERTPTAQNHDIVVALLDEEATVKEYFKEDGYFRLQPHNSEFEPILVDEVVILGKVISLIRNYEG